jgi:hypothetical protein
VSIDPKMSDWVRPTLWIVAVGVTLAASACGSAASYDQGPPGAVVGNEPTSVNVVPNSVAPAAGPEVRPRGAANPFANVNWTTMMAANCVPEIRFLQIGDVTNDGVPDGIVVWACESPTSGFPEIVDVYDGRLVTGTPKLITRLLGEHDGLDVRGLRVGAVYTSKGAIRVLAGAYTDEDSNAEPSRWLSFNFSYQRGSFVRGETKQGEASCSSLQFGPNTNSGTNPIGALGVDCDTAYAVARGSQTSGSSDYDANSFHCVATKTARPYNVYYSCTGPTGDSVSFESR